MVPVPIISLNLFRFIPLKEHFAHHLTPLHSLSHAFPQKLMGSDLFLTLPLLYGTLSHSLSGLLKLILLFDLFLKLTSSRNFFCKSVSTPDWACLFVCVYVLALFYFYVFECEDCCIFKLLFITLWSAVSSDEKGRYIKVHYYYYYYDSWWCC